MYYIMSKLMAAILIIAMAIMMRVTEGSANFVVTWAAIISCIYIPMGITELVCIIKRSNRYL